MQVAIVEGGEVKPKAQVCQVRESMHGDTSALVQCLVSSSLSPRPYPFVKFIFTLFMGVFCMYVKCTKKKVSSRTEVADI